MWKYRLPNLILLFSFSLQFYLRDSFLLFFSLYNFIRSYLSFLRSGNYLSIYSHSHFLCTYYFSLLFKNLKPSIFLFHSLFIAYSLPEKDDQFLGFLILHFPSRRFIYKWLLRPLELEPITITSSSCYWSVTAVCISHLSRCSDLNSEIPHVCIFMFTITFKCFKFCDFYMRSGC